MGERDRNREAVERIAARVKAHNEAQGHRITAGEAQAQAAQVARVRDAQRDEGRDRNPHARRKVDASPEPAVASGRIVVDYGRGRK